jgi:hypothetical protein
MSYLAHDGLTHSTAITLSVNEVVILLGLALLAIALNGDHPERAWSKPELRVRDQLRPVAAGAVGLGVGVPALMWAAHGVGLSLGVALVPAVLAVGAVAVIVAHLAHRPRPWLVGLLGLFGYYVAHELALLIAPNGGSPSALAAMTLFGVTLPAVPWGGQAVRALALVGSWAAMSVLWTEPWMTTRSIAAAGALVAAVGSLIPFALAWADAAARGPARPRPDVPAQRVGT